MVERNENKKLNVNQLKSTFRTKNELYRFLSMDGKAFLPNVDSTNVYFLKDIFSGKKKVRSSVPLQQVVHQERGRQSVQRATDRGPGSE